jgi:4-amino-4-deoxy-L-arabinose transferase-like glycosyltransferase
MQNRRNTGAVPERLRFFGGRVFASSSGSKRLLGAAALLHVLLAVGLFSAGRAHVAPGLIDHDGIIGSFALDSYDYQREAARLVEIFRLGGVTAWAAERGPLHVKVISIQFAILGPLFGYGTLSAEPFNLLCYVAILGVTLALGREVGGQRAGLLAAGVVALWPTFLLHTMQLLKDPFFIACALVLVLCVTVWLTRTFALRGVLATGSLTAVVVSLLLVVRSTFAVIIFALVLIGFALLVVRQLRERRPLYWNMICPLLILLIGALLLPLHATRGGQKLKHYPSDQGGQPKAIAGEGLRVLTVVSYLPRPKFEEGPPTYADRFYASANRMVLRVSSVRERFAAVYSQSGSNIDPGVKFSDLKSLMFYLPRAFEIACCAPFATTWVAPGKQVGSAGRLLAGAETLIMYLFELLALVAVLWPPRRLAAWLLLSISAFGVTLLALVVPNVGALYRFRYTFWVLLIVLGAKGFEALLASSGRMRPGLGGVLSLLGGSWIRRVAVGVGMVGVLAAACSRSPQAGPTLARTDSGLHAQGTESPATTNIAAAGLTRDLSFDLVNFSGSALQAVHISPSDSKGWEENVLGSSQLGDGETVDIRFDAQEKAALWDIRVESEGKYYAEWKGLDLRGVSRITLLLSVVGEPVAVAQVE